MKRRHLAWGWLLLVAGAAAALWLQAQPGALAPDTGGTAPAAAAVQRGAYLAVLGHCRGCHTARGGAPMAGGRPVETPFGSVISANLTPDRATGLGDWSAAAFRRALREGVARDGRRLAPACPYPNFTLITDADADDLHAYLRSLAPQVQAQRTGSLRWPYRTQFALAVWQWWYLRPGPYQPDSRQDAAWNRGAYLAGGPGHCAACHGRRNALGAHAGPWALDGGTAMAHGWIAPALNSPHAAGVAHWTEQEVVDWFAVGRTARATALGPMAEVVLGSTQHWAQADLRALAVYLRALPQHTPAVEAAAPAEPPAVELGRRLYEKHCADCHGAQGEGRAPAYPALAGLRTLGLASPANALRVVLGGAFAPATAGHARPYGMPPFGHALDDAQLAALLSYLRQAFANGAAPVSALQVQQLR